MKSYEERCAELGIQRPKSLTEGFDDSPNGAICKEPEVTTQIIGERVNPNPPPKDLSHLNPARGFACREITRAWWASLSPQQKKELAKRRGVHYEGRNYKKAFRGV